MAERIFTIAQLNKAVAARFAELNREKVAALWFEGEVSEWKPSPAGHFYLTLKDAEAAVPCILFKWDLGGCDAAFRVKAKEGRVTGSKVQVQGLLSLYEPTGRYQFQLKRVRLSGAGELYARFLELRERFRAEGLFDPAKKRPLPFLPHAIGIVTSATGSVIHDMCRVITRRFPNMSIRLFPVKVQGPGAAEEIARGIAYFNGLPPDGDFAPDVLIVGRGGGSLEDLWAFNEEPVVRALAASRIPTVSAVGHQDDFTLADYAADVRAGTPSMAGERVVPEKDELRKRLAVLEGRLLARPRERLELYVQKADALAIRLEQAPKTRLAEARTRLERLAPRLRPALDLAFQKAAHRVEQASEKLRLLSPYGVLERGYSITLDAAGRVVRASDGVKPGDALVTRLAQGEVRSVVS